LALAAMASEKKEKIVIREERRVIAVMSRLASSLTMLFASKRIERCSRKKKERD
jgi:hypothetical protein